MPVECCGRRRRLAAAVRTSRLKGRVWLPGATMLGSNSGVGVAISRGSGSLKVWSMLMVST